MADVDELFERWRTQWKAEAPERAARWKKRREEHLAELAETVKTMSPDELIEAHARYVIDNDIESRGMVRDELVKLIQLGRKSDG